MGLVDLKRAEYRLRRAGHSWFPFNLPKWLLWLFVLLTVFVYGFVFYHFFVSPMSLRWKGIFGTTFPAGYSIRGIDISHYQGQIDWKKLKQASLNDERVSFVLMKATEGTDFQDEYFVRNMTQAKEEGFICGAYHFFLPSEPAEAQARYFMENVSLENGDFPPVLDIEHRGNLNEKQIREAALTWLQIVEAHYGVKPIIYTNYKFKLAYLDDSLTNTYPYWIAHYYVDSLQYKGKWKLWQYTDNGQLDGINGRVDFNLYNGSMYDLQKFLIGHKEENDFSEEDLTTIQ